MLMLLFSYSSISAQSFLKKLENAAKKATNTENLTGNQKNSSRNDYQAPLIINIESTRFIGDRLLVSGKIQTSEDIRVMNMAATLITPDGDIYESRSMWWGGQQLSPMSFDKNLTAGINYNFDQAFEIKGKPVNAIASLTFDSFNHTAQKKFKIAIKDLMVPVPANPNLNDPSVTEIFKNVYMRWTKAEETASGLKLNFVVENKNSKDLEIQFRAYNKAKIIDNEGNSYEADITLRDNMNFIADTPIAGNITLDKPVKVSEIALLEFSSRFFDYKIRKIVIP